MNFLNQMLLQTRFGVPQIMHSQIHGQHYVTHEPFITYYQLVVSHSSNCNISSVIITINTPHCDELLIAFLMASIPVQHIFSHVHIWFPWPWYTYTPLNRKKIFNDDYWRYQSSYHAPCQSNMDIASWWTKYIALSLSWHIRQCDILFILRLYTRWSIYGTK